MRRWLLLLWVAMVVEAFVIAPPELPSTGSMIWRILTFDWVGISPALIALFYAVGIVVMLHFSLLVTEPRETKPHPLYLLVPALALGSFLMLPYYALRRHGPKHEPKEHWLGHPVIRTVLFAAFIGLTLYGTLAGDMGMFWYELTTRKFSHVMAIDFVVLVLLLPAVTRL